MLCCDRNSVAGILCLLKRTHKNKLQLICKKLSNKSVENYQKNRSSSVLSKKQWQTLLYFLRNICKKAWNIFPFFRASLRSQPDLGQRRLQNACYRGGLLLLEKIFLILPILLWSGCSCKAQSSSRQWRT